MRKSRFSKAHRGDLTRVRLALWQCAPESPINGAHVERLANVWRTCTTPSDAARVAPVRLALEVLFANNPMLPLVAHAVRVPEHLARIESRVQPPVAFPLGIERLPRRDTLVDISGKDEAVWQPIVPSHNSLDDAMKPAELRERGHVDSSPNRRILPFKNDKQLR